MQYTKPRFIDNKSPMTEKEGNSDPTNIAYHIESYYNQKKTSDITVTVLHKNVLGHKNVITFYLNKVIIQQAIFFKRYEDFYDTKIDQITIDLTEYVYDETAITAVFKMLYVANYSEHSEIKEEYYFQIHSLCRFFMFERGELYISNCMENILCDQLFDVLNYSISEGCMNVKSICMNWISRSITTNIDPVDWKEWWPRIPYKLSEEILMDNFMFATEEEKKTLASDIGYTYNNSDDLVSLKLVRPKICGTQQHVDFLWKSNKFKLSCLCTSEMEIEVGISGASGENKSKGDVKTIVDLSIKQIGMKKRREKRLCHELVLGGYRQDGVYVFSENEPLDSIPLSDQIDQKTLGTLFGKNCSVLNEDIYKGKKAVLMLIQLKIKYTN